MSFFKVGGTYRQDKTGYETTLTKIDERGIYGSWTLDGLVDDHYGNRNDIFIQYGLDERGWSDVSSFSEEEMIFDL